MPALSQIPGELTMKRIRILLIAGAAVPWLACSDPMTTPEADPEPILLTLPELVVSNAVQAGESSPVLGGALVSASSAAVAYVSLPPGTVPDMVSVVIRNATTNWASQVAPVLDGGVDPVPVAATAGDQLRLEFTDRDGAVAVALATVPGTRPPTVVRTAPPRGRTDVALTVWPAVVFSEPIDPATLAAGVRLTLGGAAVEGSVVLLPDLPWIARFLPAAELEPLATYELHVTTEIRDLDGDELGEPLAVPFTTGGPSSPVGGKYERVSPSTSPGTSWYEFEDNHRFTLFYHLPDMAPFGWGGRYARVGSRLHLNFDAWSAAGPMQADAMLNGDSLWVEYNIVMMLTDFEDGLYVRQSPPPEPPTGSTAILSGLVQAVTADGVVPAAGARVWFFIFETASGSMSGRTFGYVTTDANGEFARSDLPSSGEAVIYVYKEGYAQPCAAHHPYDRSGRTADIRIYSHAALLDPDVTPPSDHSPMLSGRVYAPSREDKKPRPVAGARLSMEHASGLGLVGATTWSNANGDYFLCRIPPGGAFVYASVTGYPIQERWVEAADQRLDFEF
jgi:hypothetical protein